MVIIPPLLVGWALIGKLCFAFKAHCLCSDSLKKSEAMIRGMENDFSLR